MDFENKELETKELDVNDLIAFCIEILEVDEIPQTHIEFIRGLPTDILIGVVKMFCAKHLKARKPYLNKLQNVNKRLKKIFSGYYNNTENKFAKAIALQVELINAVEEYETLIKDDCDDDERERISETIWLIGTNMSCFIAMDLILAAMTSPDEIPNHLESYHQLFHYSLLKEYIAHYFTDDMPEVYQDITGTNVSFVKNEEICKICFDIGMALVNFDKFYYYEDGQHLLMAISLIQDSQEIFPENSEKYNILQYYCNVISVYYRALRAIHYSMNPSVTKIDLSVFFGDLHLNVIMESILFVLGKFNIEQLPQILNLLVECFPQLEERVKLHFKL